MTQSRWVAAALEKANPGTTVELVPIETQGDRIQDVPLSKIEGKEFFTAELDRALIDGQADLAVHSLKDLSLDRPKELVLAGIPKRALAHDMILFRTDRLAEKRLRIGTSSPRRLENLPGFLNWAFPANGEGSRPEMLWLEIRGNVNSRLLRLKEPANSPRALDGVVLALAGVSRLFQSPEHADSMRALLGDTKIMVVPTSISPSAPGQGALAIECRSDASEVRAMIAKLHDPTTEASVRTERAELEKWGGGCHQRFGAHAFTHPRLGNVVRTLGKSLRGETIDEWRLERPPSLKNRFSEDVLWDGGDVRGDPETFSDSMVALSGETVFVSNARAAQTLEPSHSNRFFAAGSATWKKLADRGFWVEGSSDGLGADELMLLVNEPLLKLPAWTDWVILTHEAAASEWSDRRSDRIRSTYRVTFSRDSSTIGRLKRARCFFWTSFSQFQAFRDVVPSGATHCTGPGKTATAFERDGLSCFTFVSREDWKKWVRT